LVYGNIDWIADPVIECGGDKKATKRVQASWASIREATSPGSRNLRKQMGHSRISTTLDLYGHVLRRAYATSGKEYDEAVFGTNSEDENVIPFPAQKRKS